MPRAAAQTTLPPAARAALAAALAAVLCGPAGAADNVDDADDVGTVDAADAATPQDAAEAADAEDVADAERARWWPVSVEVRDPPFNEDASFVRLDYTPGAGASRPWQLCASYPNLDIEYFLAVASGVRVEAARQGVEVTVHVAGDFDGARQATQLGRCLDDGADALLILAGAREPLLDVVLARAAGMGVVVIDLVTGLGTSNVTARIAADAYAIGHAVGAYLADQYPAGSDGASVAWMSSPPSIYFTAGYDAGFRAALADSSLEIAAAVAMPLDAASLERSVEDLLAEADGATAIAGVSPAIVVAERLLAARVVDTPLVATAITSEIMESIAAGRINAAVNSLPTHQGRIAVDLAVRALEGRPFMAELRPTLEVIDQSNVEVFDRSSVMVSPD